MQKTPFYLAVIISLFWPAFCTNVGQSGDVAGCTPAGTTAPAWSANVKYGVDSKIVYNNKLYQCLQAHTSQADWFPTAVPDLWATPTPCGVTEWSTQTLYKVGSEVTWNGVTYVCIQGHESQHNWDPAATPALWNIAVPSGLNPGPPSCTVTEVNGFRKRHIESVAGVEGTGTIIKVVIDQANEITGSGETASGRSSQSLRVQIGADELITESTTLFANGTTVGSIHWGSLIQGANSASFTVINSTVSGSIDGRAFNPFNATADKTGAGVTFVDGGPSPVLTAVPGVNATMRGLSDIISTALKSCPSDAPSSNSPPYANATMTLFRRAADRSQDHGHFSSTYSDGGCDTCKLAASAAVIAAEVGCVAATCWWSFGVGCVACTAAAVAAEVTAIAACEFSSACCPVNCGRGSYPLNPPTCCRGGESCLDGNGHCCSAGQPACAGKACNASMISGADAVTSFNARV